MESSQLNGAASLNQSFASWENNRRVVCLDVWIKSTERSHSIGGAVGGMSRAVDGVETCGVELVEQTNIASLEQDSTMDFDEQDDEEEEEELKPKDVIEILNDINMYVSARGEGFPWLSLASLTGICILKMFLE
ncbi:UNVERIFIED_CONTAM: hypothetical protein HDU68_002253 [Siphonaria sp. JEL0065]|nr:hypothetical protein HDU68_002253 [Siphonaria sp. JEL0065]